MSDFSSYSESNVVNWMVGGQDMPSAPSSIYIALHTEDPTNSGENNEVDAGGYSRQETTADLDWDISNNTFSNLDDILFDEATADWGEVTHFTLWDGPDSSDNAIAHSELERVRDIQIGDAPVFRDGTLNGSVN